MKSTLCFILCIGVALAGVTREKRQANCVEPDIPNVCTGGSLGGRIYFPHPTDVSRFIQCADGGRMFIIRCPMGERFDVGKSSCAMLQTVPTPTVTNPCTAQNMATGNIFFAYPNDKTKFIECNRQGQPTVLDCPSRLVYSATRQSCVLGSTTGTGGTGTATGTGTMTGGTATGTGTAVGNGNPCTAQAITNNNLLFAHPDPTKFIQCDLAGDAYVMQCPASLIWNQKTTNCASPFLGVISGNGLIG